VFTAGLHVGHVHELDRVMVGATYLSYRVMAATESVAAAGVVTRDLGGRATTAGVTRAVCDRLGRRTAPSRPCARQRRQRRHRHSALDETMCEAPRLTTMQPAMAT